MYSVCVRKKFDTLRDKAEKNTIQSVYNSLSVTIEEPSIQILPKVSNRPKRPWMTEAILTLVDDRRKSKD